MCTAWCNDSAADTLLGLAKTSAKDNERILALRGYISIAGLETVNIRASKRCEMFKAANALATRPDEKRLIIGNLRMVRHADALAMVGAYLDDPALRDEAEQSAADMNGNFRKDKALAPAIKGLATKLLTSKNKGIVDKAKRALADRK